MVNIGVCVCVHYIVPLKLSDRAEMCLSPDACVSLWTSVVPSSLSFPLNVSMGFIGMTSNGAFAKENESVCIKRKNTK